MVVDTLVTQDLFGDGLLSSYAPPASNASMYGHQRGHTQPGVYQQPQPHPQPGFQYGQPTGAGQLASGYLQPQPAGPPALSHVSVSGYGAPPSAGLAFDGPVRQRSHSDNSGIGQLTQSSIVHSQKYRSVSCSTAQVLVECGLCVFLAFSLSMYRAAPAVREWHGGNFQLFLHSRSEESNVAHVCFWLCAGDVNSAPDPFSSLGGLAGTLPSQPVSRQASGSSMYSGHDTSARPAWSPTPAPSQPFGQYAQPGSSASQAGNNFVNSAFSGSNYASAAQHQAPGPSRPPPKSSGNPFA